MIEKISNLVVNKIIDENNTSDEKREVLLFGVTRIIEDIPKTIGIVLIGILLGIIKEMAIVTAVIVAYKTFVGGVHSQTNFACFVYSLLFYLAIVYSAKYIVIQDTYYLYACLFIFALYTIFTYVPADIPEIPKVDEILRKTLKIKALVMLCLIYIITIVFIQNVYISNIIIYSIFFINLMATRTMYKLFNNKYGYETYIPDEMM